MIIKSLKISEQKRLPKGRVGRIYPLLYLISILFIIPFTGCQDDKISYAEDCEFALSLTANTQLNAQTRASALDTLLPEPNINNFKVQVLNPSGKLLKEWERYSEVANPIKIQTGTFTLKASHGEQHTGAFDAPYFEGSTEFGVRRGERTEVAITCYLANVMVTPSYTDKFKAYFKDYKVNVSSSGEPVVFTKDEKRAAFFEPGQLSVIMYLTKQDGTSFAFPAAQISKTKGKEYYRFNFDLTGEPGNEKLQISFNTSTIDSTVTIDVSQGWIAGEPPVYLNTGFISGQEFSHMEGTESPTTISTLITAPSRIKSCVLSTNSDQLIQAGWPAKEIDLTTADTDTRARLRTMGLKWTEKLSGLNMALIDFTGIIPLLPGGEEDIKHTFSVKTTDDWGQTTPQPLTVAFITSTPSFKLSPHNNVWVKTTDMDFNFTITKGDIGQIRLEYNDGKDETWKEISYTKDGGGNNYTLKAHNINFTSPTANIRAIYGKAGKTSPISFTVINPTFQIEQNGLPWAKRISLNLTETNGDFLFRNSTIENEIKVQAFVNEVWVDKTFKIQKGNTNTDPIHFEVTGLDDNTQQQLRIVYDGGIGESTDIVNFITELANNSLNYGIEESWTEENLGEVNKGGQHGYKAIQDKRIQLKAAIIKHKFSNWSTVNDKTIQNLKQTNANTWYIIPSTLVSTEANEGNRALLIRSVKWDNNGVSVPSNVGGALWENRKLEDCTPPNISYSSAGKFFTGTYKYENGSESYNTEIPFESRPTGIKFYYKYKTTTNDPNDEGLIKAYIKDAEGAIIATLEQNLTKQDAYGNDGKVIKFNYNKLDKKAAMISILFASSNKCSPDQSVENSQIKTLDRRSEAISVGSELYIDDIELIYE